MAKTKPQTSPSTVSHPLRRLYRLIAVLADKPQTRKQLVRRLKIGLRGFYRDLKAAREAGVPIALRQGKYQLEMDSDDAWAMLPFPDPQLTLQEAQALAKGRTKAHRKLRQQILDLVG